MRLRILHTSDWHIGRKLKEHDRTDEFRKFFEWLSGVIRREEVDALIVSGDIFDSRNPSADAQEIYYSFLAEISGKTCRHVVITSGNHDSAALIDAPAGIMRRCEVHVVGRSSDDEIITLNDESGKAEMIVCAVPFLHESDFRLFGNTDAELKTGIKNHYAEIFTRAREIRGDDDIPIIATGHLFLESGKTRTDEGERSIYLGTAIKVGTDIFPEDVGYVALGHLHSPQSVGRSNIRYSGSPIHMSFGEWGITKTVSIVEFAGRNFAGIREVEIPVWQKMARISGDMAVIERELRALMDKDESVWAEVTYTGRNSAGDLQERIYELVKDSAVDVLSIKDESPRTNISCNKPDYPITIRDMKPLEMLKRYFEENGVTEEEQEIYRPLYKEVLRELELDDAE